MPNQPELVLACVVCERETPSVLGGTSESPLQRARIFAAEEFAYWRCRHCGSIHARDEVDLALLLRAVSVSRSAQRLAFQRDAHEYSWRGSGAPASSVLTRSSTTGCGSWQFHPLLARERLSQGAWLRRDREEYRDRSVLGERYDCIISQDVIEHVSSPNALLAELGRERRTWAIVAIGTPNASAIDLGTPGLRSRDSCAISPTHPFEGCAHRRRQATGSRSQSLLFDDVYEYPLSPS